MNDIDDEFDKAKGKAKEAAGKATGDDDLADEGRGDQAMADAKSALKGAGEKLSDAADKVRDVFKKK